MTFGAEIWGPALISAAGSIGGGLLSRPSNKETKQQKMSRKVAEELVASLKGNGPYSDLFQRDENAFQKSFVEPSLSRFRNQIAPQIRQQYIATGQQGNSGLEDQLLRAGVDLDQMLNEKYLAFQQGGQDRMSNALNSVLGAGPGAARQMSSGEALGQSVGGYLSSPAFGDAVKGIFGQQPQAQQAMPARPTQTPKGFAPDWQDWQLGDQRWKGGY